MMLPGVVKPTKLQPIPHDRVTLTISTIEGSVTAVDAELAPFSLALITRERLNALESLWSAWKKVHASGVGYDPAFHEAVKRLEELERGQ